MRFSPIACARPVENVSSPSANPPPYSSVIPQSIFTASSHDSVNLRSRQSTGSRKSNEAPIMAATPSGIAFE